MSKPEWAIDLPPPTNRTAKGRTPRKTDMRGKTPGSQAQFFQKGRAKTGGKQKHADVFQMLEAAAHLANERATKGDKLPIEQLTADHFMTNLIERVQRINPETAAKVLAPLVYPKASFKPLDIEVDLTSDAGIAATLEQIAQRMAKGGDISSLDRLFQTVQAVQQSRALAIEMDLSRKELNDGV